MGVNLGLFGAMALSRLRPPAVAAPAGPAVPGDPAADPRPEGPLPRRFGRLADRLGLEGEARERFLDRQREFFRTTVRERRRLVYLHSELRRELTAPAPDRRRADALAQEISRTYLALERALAANVLDSRELLDERQERLFLEVVSRLRPGRLAEPRPGWRRRLRERPAREP